MRFGFLDGIFGEKGLEIDTYNPPKFIWSYHIHICGTRVGQSGPERQN